MCTEHIRVGPAANQTAVFFFCNVKLIFQELQRTLSISEPRPETRLPCHAPDVYKRQEIKDGLLNKDMSDIEKNQAINEIQSMVRTKIIYPAQAKNITVYDTDGNIFYRCV